MPHHTPPTFEALPVEVLSNILRQMSSPEDLYSTIRASPRAFGSFLCFREKILIGVLQACLHVEIFAEFLGLLHAPKYEDYNYVPTQSELQHWAADGVTLDWETSKCDDWPHLVNSFFERHFDNVRFAGANCVQRYRTPQPADKQEVNYLMSTYGMLKRFIYDYQLFARANMERIAPHMSDLGPASSQRREYELDEYGDWPDLSEIETLRLQRGFLRYELCCRVNTIPDRVPLIIKMDVQGIEDKFHPISRYVCRWEEEEVRCVYTYVHQQYLILVRDIVADFRCDVRRLSKKTQEMPDSEVIIAPSITPGRDQFYLENWAYSMASYGLPLLQQLLRSGFDDQSRFLQNTCREGVDDQQFELLDDETSLRNRLERSTSPRASPSGPGASIIYMPMIGRLSNEIWGRWGKAETGLKEQGWIFWEDHTRLMHFAMLEQVKAGGFSVVDCRNPPTPHVGFEEEVRAIWEGYPEQIMYVTHEDRRALLDKYAAKELTPEEENFFLCRLRVISDQPSKDVQPVFQEICSGMPSVEFS